VRRPTEGKQLIERKRIKKKKSFAVHDDVTYDKKSEENVFRKKQQLFFRRVVHVSFDTVKRIVFYCVRPFHFGGIVCAVSYARRAIKYIMKCCAHIIFIITIQHNRKGNRGGGGGGGNRRARKGELCPIEITNRPLD